MHESHTSSALTRCDQRIFLRILFAQTKSAVVLLLLLLWFVTWVTLRHKELIFGVELSLVWIAEFSDLKRYSSYFDHIMLTQNVSLSLSWAYNWERFHNEPNPVIFTAFEGSKRAMVFKNPGWRQSWQFFLFSEYFGQEFYFWFETFFFPRARQIAQSVIGPNKRALGRNLECFMRKWFTFIVKETMGVAMPSMRLDDESWVLEFRSAFHSS